MEDESVKEDGSLTNSPKKESEPGSCTTSPTAEEVHGSKESLQENSSVDKDHIVEEEKESQSSEETRSISRTVSTESEKSTVVKKNKSKYWRSCEERSFQLIM